MVASINCRALWIILSLKRLYYKGLLCKERDGGTNLTEDFICIQQTVTGKLKYVFDLNGKRQPVPVLDYLLLKTTEFTFNAYPLFFVPFSYNGLSPSN